MDVATVGVSVRNNTELDVVEEMVDKVAEKNWDCIESVS